MTKFDFLSLQIWTLRITGTGVQKTSCYSTKYHYTTLTLNPLTWKIWWATNNASRWQMGFNSAFKGLKVVCGKLWVQPGLLGPLLFFPKTINSHWYFTQILIQISNTYSVTNCLCHSSERQCNSLLKTICCWWHNNKTGIVASSSARFNLLDFLHLEHVKGYVYKTITLPICCERKKKRRKRQEKNRKPFQDVQSSILPAWYI